MKREAAGFKHGLKQLKNGAMRQLTKKERVNNVAVETEFIPRLEFHHFKERLAESVRICVDLVFDGVEHDRQLAKFMLEVLSSDGNNDTNIVARLQDFRTRL
jgi:hypothetical protein